MRRAMIITNEYQTIWVLECGCQKQRPGRMTMADETIERFYCDFHHGMKMVTSVYEGVFPREDNNGTSHNED